MAERLIAVGFLLAIVGLVIAGGGLLLGSKTLETTGALILLVPLSVGMLTLLGFIVYDMLYVVIHGRHKGDSGY